MGESKEGEKKAQMGFVEAYEYMTGDDSGLYTLGVRRAGWPSRLSLCVDDEVYLDHTINPAKKHIDRMRNQRLLTLYLAPPDGQDGTYDEKISQPWCPSHDDLIATD